MKKIAVIALTLSLCAGLLTACRGGNPVESMMPSESHGNGNSYQTTPDNRSSDNRDNQRGNGTMEGITQSHITSQFG